eukprot:673705-Rhodomonas_salina.1
MEHAAGKGHSKSAIPLRAPYAMPDTHIAHGPTFLCAPYAMPGTHIAYGPISPRGTDLARIMVLTSRVSWY